jgi:hypothetical protein
MRDAQRLPDLNIPQALHPHGSDLIFLLIRHREVLQSEELSSSLPFGDGESVLTNLGIKKQGPVGINPTGP